MNIAQWVERVGTELDEAGLHFGHGTDNAHDEAAWLVLHVIDAPLDGTFNDWSRELQVNEEIRVRQLMEARIRKKVPLAYLTGTARFAGLEFETVPAVLVPRSPLAELIMEQFRPWLVPENVSRVLDLCTGSACIALAIARHMPWTRVDAADISGVALEVAARNVKRHGLESRVNLFESDLFHSLPPCRYDLIVTNPPYVPDESVRLLPDEYQAEPALGLASGEDGLDACLSILATAAEYLAPQGVLICEVGESEQRLQSLLPGVPFVWLEFTAGGSGVFVLTREELDSARPLIGALLEERQHVS